jgi:methionyl-tRNA formyltransferase
VIIWRTSPLTDAVTAPPGTVIHAGSDGLHVATGDGRALALLELQSEGGRPLRTAEFLRGHAVQAGARFANP